MADIPTTAIRNGFAIGALIVFSAVFLLALAFDVGTTGALLAAVGVGLVVGGGIGALIALRLAADQTPRRR